MTTTGKLRIPGGLVLAVFFGCSTGSVLIVDDLAPQQASAQHHGGHDVDEGYFYSNLAPHGQWFFQADFGWVWHPARVNVGWRPYTEGQWVWADDAGWTWASYEPWGWATYHYGRWYFDPMFGWSWVPGRTWAPAWVSWRVEAGYIGWAPLWPAYFDLHPEYRWDRWRHDNDWDRRHHGSDWDRWVFTRDRDFTSDRVGRRAITDRRQRDEIFSRSRDVTQYDESRPERIGHSIDRAMVEKATGRPVRSVKIEAADKPLERDDARGESIRMFRPRVKDAPDKTPDRLGLAKEPKREAPETDTIRQEKKRLDGVPEKDRVRDKAAAGPAVREKDDERGGGGPASNGKIAERGKPERAAPGESLDKADRGQEKADRPSQRPESKQQPAARVEKPARDDEPQKAKPQKATRVEQEPTATEPVQSEPKPNARPAPKQQAERKQQVAPKQHQERTGQQSPSNPVRGQRPSQPAPEVEKNGGGQPGGEHRDKRESGQGNTESGKKKGQPAEERDAEPGQGKH